MSKNTKLLAAVVLFTLSVLLWWQWRPAAPAPAAPPPRATPPGAAPVVSPQPPPPPEVAALHAVLRRADPGQRAREFGHLFQEWLTRDPEGALAYLRRMPPSNERAQGLLMLLNAIAQRDPPRALALAAELATTRDDRAFYSVAFDRFAQDNLATAVARLALVPVGESRENAIRALASVWARTDFAAALAWAEGLADPADRRSALETALLDLAGREPLRAFTLAQQSLTGPPRDRTLLHALQRLTLTDPANAAAQVAWLPPGELQTLATADVARALAARDLLGALAWVQTLASDTTRAVALNNVLSVWAQTDRAAAARYVGELPPGPLLDAAAPHLATLLSTNPRSAIPWAEALPSASARDAALIMIASGWAQREPREALQWAMTLRGEPLRTTAVSGAHSYWMLSDAPAARAWVETAALPAETKSKLRGAGSR